MSLCIWNEKFSVGNEQMDEHHRRLIFLLNRVDEAVSARRDDDVVGHAIEALVYHAAAHLKAEEVLMENICYPALDIHRAMHRFFAAEAALLRSMHASGQALRVLNIVQFLRDWFVYHIFNEDRKYSEYLAQASVQAA